MALGPFHTPQEVADRFNVTRATVYNWIRCGKLRAYRISPKSVRIRQYDIDQLKERQQWKAN